MSEATQQRIAGLSPEKRALLQQQIARQSRSARTEIRPRPRPERIPLSYAQQRLWLLDRLEPESAAYNVTMGLWLRGSLNVNVLTACLDALVMRHESLRTTFASDNGQPRQRIAATGNAALSHVAIDELPQSERHPRAIELARSESRTPFDLERGPLFRALLVRLSDNEHMLVLNFHHIIVDGWSLGVFFDELTKLYAAFVEGKPSPLAPLPLQYADFAMWQREWLQGETLKKQLDYWTSRLGANPPVLELPGDRSRPATQSYRGGLHKLTVSADLLAPLQKLSREEGSTLFMTFLSALEVLLLRYSGQSDFVIGSGIANRHREELEGLVGCFVNTLALRGDLSGNPTFRELLARTRKATLSAYEHQDLPVERLLEELALERSLSRSPVFQVMVFFQNFPGGDITLPGLTLTALEFPQMHSGTARCDLTLFVAQDHDHLDIYLEYNGDLFDLETIEALGAHLVTLLRSIATDPSVRISDAALLAEGERRVLLADRNATRRDVPNVPLQRLFEDQVKRTPDAQAIIAADQSLSYRELNARANALAAELVNRGVRRGDLVGLFTSRRAEMMIGLLGILKSGAAYVPLDPHFPSDRRAFMLEDSDARIVVTEERLKHDVPGTNAAIVTIDATAIDENVDGGATQNDLAYVIFTSGSTGRPKGVQIPHGAVVNFLQSMATEPGIKSGDVLCAVTTLSFDIAVLELLLPLTAGATVVIADRETSSDANALAQLMKINGVTMMQATPATWRMLIDGGWSGDANLTVLCGGEALPRDLAEKLLDRCATLWNVYGPTETTIWSTLQRVTKDDVITIGRPIANTQVYVADKNLQLVPDGVPGELLIGGDGLARGYLNRPELTAEKFIADRFSGVEGARLYRTGDVARWRRDGRLEVIGRTDHQVKLRGFRIELGEIEAVIAAHPAVRQNVVVCREDRPGDKRLVAYVVAHGTAPSASELRAHARTALPEYMIPSAFVALESLPLTPNGKVDRRALPVPESVVEEAAELVAPRTPEEETLAQIWAEVLGVERIGIDDDFFTHGGHSLLATQLIARVRKAFGIEMPLRRLFEAPTVARFAEAMLADQMASMDASALAELLQHVEGLSEDELQVLLATGGNQ